MLATILPFPARSQTADVCGQKSLTVIVRDGQYDYVPNMRFELYAQIDDVDGQPKPGDRVGSGRIDPDLGRGTLEFKDEGNDQYAIRIYDDKLDNADFWYYDKITLGCGESQEKTFQISSMDISLWSADNEPLKNYSFKLYTQKEDVAGSPTHEKKDLVGNFNTGATGGITAYVPSGSEAIDRSGPDC